MAITDLDEQVLVRAHQAGDEHAFGQIVRSQHRALYAHAYRRLGSHEAAEDAVQDTLLRAYRALPSFNGDLRLRAWLHRILTNVCHDEGNRRRRQAGLIDKLEAQPVELAPDPVEETVLHDTVRVMSEALAELPESYREALVLRYVDGLSFREVAEATGISEENARARVHRGRLALHKVLSRLSVMVAFLLPGLRRTHRALESGTDNLASTGGATDHAVSLSTQLASHVYTAAPALTRAAAEGSNLVAAKTSVVATAVAAVAAVAAPVAAYRVYDTAKTPDRPPAAVAEPAKDDADTAGATPSTTTPGDASGPVAGDGATSTTVDSTTTSLLPDSVTKPFAGAPDPDDADDASSTTSTTTAPPDDDAQVDPGPVVHGILGGTTFTVTGARPDFDLSGPFTVEAENDQHVEGTLAGRVYIADGGDSDASAELELTLADGSVHRLRFHGVVEREEPADGSVRFQLRGRFVLDDGRSLGLADGGDAVVAFQHVDGDASSALSFDLQGPASSE